MKFTHLLLWRLTKLTLGRKYHKLFNVEYRELDEEPEPPYILVSNHSHSLDPILLGMPTRYAYSYMANLQGKSGFAVRFARAIGAYQKQKGASDLGAIRETFDRVKRGEIIGIFVEGDRSWDGKLQPIYPSIIKLIRKTRLPVRAMNMRGNYLSKPRWATHPRQGKILLTSSVLSAEEVRGMTDTQLLEVISERIACDDIHDPLLADVPFRHLGKKGGFADGITNVLWLCPECGAVESLSARDNTVSCNACGLSVEVDGHLRFSPEDTAAGADLMDWLQVQKTAQGKLAGEGRFVTEGIEITEPAEGANSNQVDKQPRDAGSLRWADDRLAFVRTDGSDVFSFALEDITHYVDNFNLNFEIGGQGRHYRLYFGEKNAYRWIMLLNELRGTITGIPMAVPE